MCTEFQLRKEKVQEVDGGDGYTTVRMHLMPPNYASKKGKCYYISSQ